MYKQRISYAQNQEDIRAWRALRELGVNSQSVFYVELGMREPWVDSNTAYFYSQGGHGVLVEADASLMDEIERQRPNDISVNALINSVEMDSIEFFTSSSTGLGTANDQFKTLGESRGFRFKAVEIEAITVNSLASKFGVSEIHFMSIDIEGNEMEALKGIDFNRLRPWIICVETIVAGSNKIIDDAKTDYLLSSGYKLVAFDGVNNWYIANEHSHASRILEVPFSSVDKVVYGWITHRDFEFDQRRKQIRLGLKSLNNRDKKGSEEGKKVNVAHPLESPKDNTIVGEAEGNDSVNEENEALLRLAKDVTGYMKNEGWTFSLNSDQSRLLKFHSNAVQKRFNEFTPITYQDSPNGDWTNSFCVKNLPLLLKSDEEHSFSEYTVNEIDIWIKDNSLSSDSDLQHRLDSHGDKWGSYIANVIAYNWFLTATHNEVGVSQKRVQPGISVLFDVTTLQTSSYAERGIGKYAKEILSELLQSPDVKEVILFQDPLLGKVPEWIFNNSKVSRAAPARDDLFDMFISPSPMTLEPWQLMLGLKSCSYSAAYVYDFIPGKFKNHYLPDEIDLLRYQAQIRALKVFDQISTISNSTRTQLADLINVEKNSIDIAWPSNLTTEAGLDFHNDVPETYVTVFGGDEARKNLFVGLASWGAATAYLESRPVAFVIGYHGNQALIDEVAQAAGLRLGEAVVLPFLSDPEFKQLLSGSLLSIVPSLEEGLSLPVIESLAHFVPVAASNIEVHVELCGKSKAFGDPRSVEDFARAISYALKNRSRVLVKQTKSIRRHKHSDISLTVLNAVKSSQKRVTTNIYADNNAKGTGNSKAKRVSVGVVTPWPDQHTGVADYSKVTLEELSRHCDVTIYTDAHAPVSEKSNLEFRRTSDALQAKVSHDFVINVVGNSHFHIPAIWNLRLNGGISICHDSRMFEFYLALLGGSGLEKYLGYDSATTDLVRELETCTYRNVAFGELAHFSQGVFMHSSNSSRRVENENSVKVQTLPFVPMRVLSNRISLKGVEKNITNATKVSKGSIQVASFGSLDERTKRESVIVDACQLLRIWGLPVELTFVGDRSNVTSKSDLSPSLISSQADHSWIHLLGRVNEETMVEQMNAADIIVQLRSGPHFTTSGPVIDAIGLGKRVIASSNLVDEKYPSFVVACKENVSALELAESIKNQLATINVAAGMDYEMEEFASTFNAKNYANDLFSRLVETRKLWQ